MEQPYCIGEPEAENTVLRSASAPRCMEDSWECRAQRCNACHNLNLDGLDIQQTERETSSPNSASILVNHLVQYTVIIFTQVYGTQSPHGYTHAKALANSKSSSEQYYAQLQCNNNGHQIQVPTKRSGNAFALLGVYTHSGTDAHLTQSSWPAAGQLASRKKSKHTSWDHTHENADRCCR